ncbi:uncharacterized protein TNCV_2776761 [Trichonephila clavipes]|nr:uncharacterized protein TNCV_2776761 [Trichonephila clavipes]
MDRLRFAHHSPKISTLLTLTKISHSQEEMKYITEMRNMILFQISPTSDYRNLAKKFLHKTIMERRNVALFQKCLNHAFTEVMKSSVLVHYSAPFRHWTTVIIDSVDNPQTNQRTAQTCGRDSGITAMEQFLVPAFRDLMTDEWRLFLNRRINANVSCSKYRNPIHESTWRRLYDSKVAFFFCEHDDFILYVKEQTLESRSVNVFKEIMERQIGKTFSTTAILRRTASPYYYVLPHQNEQEYAILEATRTNSGYQIEFRSPDYMAYRFYCELYVVKASFLFNIAN